MPRISAAIILLFMLMQPALAYDPCKGPRFDSANGTQRSLIVQAMEQALSEDLTLGSDAFKARVHDLVTSPSGGMTSAAAAAQAAADAAKTACEAAAAAFPPP